MKFYLLISLGIAIQTCFKRGALNVLDNAKWTTRHFVFFPSISFTVVIAKLMVKLLQTEN